MGEKLLQKYEETRNGFNPQSKNFKRFSIQLAMSVNFFLGIIEMSYGFQIPETVMYKVESEATAQSLTKGLLMSF